MIRFTMALSGLALCTACAAPVPLTIAALMADGVSYATTEKSISDHGISALAEQDCAVHRMFTENSMCSEYAAEPVVVENDAQVVATAPQTPAPLDNQYLGSKGVPHPGVYMVISSSHDYHTARVFNFQYKDMNPQMFAMPAGNLVTYHVIAGPVTRENYPAAQQVAAKYGIENTWALKIDESDWQLARELERRPTTRQTQALLSN